MIGSAEFIALVVADLRAGRVQHVGDPFGTEISLGGFAGPVVDCTDVYQHLVENERTIAVYDDHPCIAPPWSEAIFAFVTQTGIVIVADMSVVERPADGEEDENWESSVAWFDVARGFGLEDRPAAWSTPSVVDWASVRWVAECFVWLGLAGPTCGPIIRWRYAIYDDGSPADLTWSHCGVDDKDPRLLPPEPEISSLVPLEAMNLLNCSNVDIVNYSPVSRSQRRRLERTGVRTSVIRVFPPGARRQPGAQGESLDPRHHGVRGHFASYGPKFGRGLLFGKHQGRFYIPPHVRGSTEHGETEQSYELHMNPNDQENQQ